MAAFHLLLIAFHLLLIVDGQQLAQVDGKVKQILIIIPSSFIHDMF
jgi:NADH:ubiquinone oxidoreductase subunit K